MNLRDEFQRDFGFITKVNIDDRVLSYWLKPEKHPYESYYSEPMAVPIGLSLACLLDEYMESVGLELVGECDYKVIDYNSLVVDVTKEKINFQGKEVEFTTTGTKFYGNENVRLAVVLNNSYSSFHLIILGQEAEKYFKDLISHPDRLKYFDSAMEIIPAGTVL